MIKRSEFAEGTWRGFGQSRGLPEAASYQPDHANIRRRHLQLRTHVMSPDHSAASLILKTIAIRLDPAAGHQGAEARYELALNALATALIVVDSSVSPAWTLQPAPGDDPLLFHLTPLQEQVVSISAAWEMIDALLRQAEVATVEPTFVMLRNDRQGSGDTP